MTAILTEIRRLEELRDRKAITDAEFNRRRTRLLDAVEVAETRFETGPAATRPRRATPPARPRGNALGLSIVLCLGLMGLSMGVTLLVLPDLNLALTVGVTILATLTVALLKQLDE